MDILGLIKIVSSIVVILLIKFDVMMVVVLCFGVRRFVYKVESMLIV